MAACAVSAAAMGATAATGATAQAAPPPLAPLHQVTGQTINGAYIVVLKSSTDGGVVAQHHGVAPQRVFSHALHGFAARLSTAQLAQIRQDSSVAYVEPDSVVTANAKPTPPSSGAAPGASNSRRADNGPVSGNSVETGATWGLDRVDQPYRPLNGLYRYNSTGRGVTAYIIDTGIYTAHSDFGGRATGGFTAINDGQGTADCNGHGTHVAGTVGGARYGVAKGVRLVAVRVLDCGGSGSVSGVISGIDWVTYAHTGPSVANMSLGGGNSAALNDAVTNSIASGVTYSVAAGNSGADACNFSPASTPGALTVAATDSTDTRASFSNVGSCVDTFAPGVNITSDWIGGTTATNTISGTSMAAPHVTGLAALYLQNAPYSTPATVNRIITTDAVAGVVTDPAGSPNRLARKWTGSLSGTGAISYEPDGAYWNQNAGYIQAWLQGAGGTDTDLYLQQWNGSAWVYVASSISNTPQERIVYNGTAGYYRAVAYAYSGGGTYDVWVTHP